MSLKQLLRSMSAEFAAETPSLDHSVGLTDAGGSPEMKPAPAAYLGLLASKKLDIIRDEKSGRLVLSSRKGKDDRPDNWRGIACRTDPDGLYITPLHCALERIPDSGQRSFLRAILTNVYFPSDIADIYDIPAWAAGYVVYGSVEFLARRYTKRPLAPTRTSEAQQIAEAAA